jgi:hypothetical protein
MAQVRGGHVHQGVARAIESAPALCDGRLRTLASQEISIEDRLVARRRGVTWWQLPVEVQSVIATLAAATLTATTTLAATTLATATLATATLATALGSCLGLTVLIGWGDGTATASGQHDANQHDDQHHQDSKRSAWLVVICTHGQPSPSVEGAAICPSSPWVSMRRLTHQGLCHAAPRAGAVRHTRQNAGRTPEGPCGFDPT